MPVIAPDDIDFSVYLQVTDHQQKVKSASLYVQALLEAYTPQALVWASDWPFLRAPDRIDYGPLQSLFEQLVPDAVARRAILWDTPKRLFGL